ncbi:ISL3 family transposase [Acidisoma cladoniae]|jgi:transposase|uniref:ISL3 family transposase n=1 Tax=Acidisoma cladoniae TaxID=3040935 RepID=UPI00254E0FAC|nr:ISL3 family transposase [Acidisoma sp. PAMC 29798]
MKAMFAFGLGIHVLGAERVGAEWVVSAPGDGLCPACGCRSKARHSSYWRRLRDLPMHGIPVVVRLRVARLRCREATCDQKIFAEQPAGLAEPLVRRTCQVVDILQALGHAAGGKPAERILSKLGLQASDDTVLHHLKRRSRARSPRASLRVVGIDDWSWTKGQTYGTIMVDLERRRVVDILSDRSSTSTAAWLRAYPGVEVVSRERHGLYAEGARDGAPQAVQVADRFHLLQNLRERIEQQLGRLGRPLRRGASVAAEAADTRAGLHGVREDLFAQVRALYDAGKTATTICEELGLSHRRVDRWVRLERLPPRNAIARSPRSPGHFHDYLARRSKEGCTLATRLFTEIKGLGYTGCYTHLARLLAPWRSKTSSKGQGNARQPPPSSIPLPRDPTTGRPLSPLTAGALCIKPRPLLSVRQRATVDALKANSPEFVVMRQLAMRFRGILRSRNIDALGRWLKDAHDCRIYGMQRFARMLQNDLDAVTNALTLPWSNGQTEGQISRLKTLKRSMYGRAGVELLRARVLPF